MSFFFFCVNPQPRGTYLFAWQPGLACLVQLTYESGREPTTRVSGDAARPTVYARYALGAPTVERA